MAAAIDRLQAAFRPERERPHDLGGVQARPAAAVGRHNFCSRLNRKPGRPDLAIAHLPGR